MDICSVVASGVVTQMPEKKEAGNYTIAHTSIKCTRNKGGKEHFSFFTIVGFNKMAETIMSYCVPGIRVMVRGEVRTSMYQEKVRVEFIANELIPLDVGKKEPGKEDEPDWGGEY